MSKALLIDLDGTIYRGNTIIPGADRFIQLLQSHHIPYLFVTNNSSRTPEVVAEHLQAIGIPCDAEHVCTTAQAAAQYVLDHKLGAKAYVIGETGLREALKEMNIEIVEDGPDFVIQGIDREFDYEKLKKAVQFIRDGSPYVLTNPDLKLPSDSGFLPGAGTIAAAIQAGSEAEPHLIGKPSSVIMNYALSKLGLSANDVWVIGDGMRTDIAAGKAVGCQTALVLTGVTTKQNFEQECAAANVSPDLVCDTLDDVFQHIFPSSGER